MTNLSQSAQAVLDAFWKDLDFREDFTVGNIAAALRAAAYETDWEFGDPKLLLEGIAAELEGLQ